MRDNRTILDEAARSIRRTFIGSIAGTITMFAVIGAAGAYGLQDKLTAQGLSGAFASLHAKLTPLIERATPYFERSKPAQSEEPSQSGSPARPPRPMPMVMPDQDEGAVVPLPPPAAAMPLPAVPVATVPPSAAPEAPAAVVAPVVVEKAPEPPRAEPQQVKAKQAEPQQAEPKPAAEAVVAVEAPAEPTAPAPAAEPKATMTVAALPGAAALPWDLIAAPRATLGITDTAMTTPAAGVVAPESAPAASSPARSASGPAPMAGRLPPYRTASLGEAAAASGSAAFAKASVQAEPDAIVNTVTEPQLVFLHLPRPKPPLSPAQRLELQGKDYDKAEKCLAQAIYFEARNEPVRGQQAVAQVVLNRVFSPHYPKDVCSVVFQNAHRHLSCQFTFACDGKPEAIRERGAWARAQRIARQTLEASIWLPDVNKATHYHAAYVRPNWIRDMKVMVRHGLHTFYRPRNWGDGSNEAKWGTPSNSVTSAPTAVKPLTPAQKRFSYRRA